MPVVCQTRTYDHGMDHAPVGWPLPLRAHAVQLQAFRAHVQVQVVASAGGCRRARPLPLREPEACLTSARELEVLGPATLDLQKMAVGQRQHNLG